jgi:hypothetical protein
LVPLYLNEGDVVAAVNTLEDFLTSSVYREPAYQTKLRVT